MTDREMAEMAVDIFEASAVRVGNLTSGNLVHGKNNIKGLLLGYSLLFKKYLKEQ